MTICKEVVTLLFPGAFSLGFSAKTKGFDLLYPGFCAIFSEETELFGNLFVSFVGKFEKSGCEPGKGVV